MHLNILLSAYLSIRIQVYFIFLYFDVVHHFLLINFIINLMLLRNRVGSLFQMGFFSWKINQSVCIKNFWGNFELIIL